MKKILSAVCTARKQSRRNRKIISRFDLNYNSTYAHAQMQNIILILSNPTQQYIHKHLPVVVHKGLHSLSSTRKSEGRKTLFTPIAHNYLLFIVDGVCRLQSHHLKAHQLPLSPQYPLTRKQSTILIILLCCRSLHLQSLPIPRQDSWTFTNNIAENGLSLLKHFADRFLLLHHL